MYGVYTYIYHKNWPNVGKYTVHWASGIITAFQIISHVTFFALHRMIGIVLRHLESALSKAEYPGLVQETVGKWRIFLMVMNHWTLQWSRGVSTCVGVQLLKIAPFKGSGLLRQVIDSSAKTTPQFSWNHLPPPSLPQSQKNENRHRFETPMVKDWCHWHLNSHEAQGGKKQNKIDLSLWRRRRRRSSSSSSSK